MSERHPFPGTSPNGVFYASSDKDQPFGFLEATSKCPYFQCNNTHGNAHSSPGFTCSCALELGADGRKYLKIRR